MFLKRLRLREEAVVHRQEVEQYPETDMLLVKVLRSAIEWKNVSSLGAMSSFRRAFCNQASRFRRVQIDPDIDNSDIDAKVSTPSR